MPPRKMSTHPSCLRKCPAASMRTLSGERACKRGAAAARRPIQRIEHSLLFSISACRLAANRKVCAASKFQLQFRCSTILNFARSLPGHSSKTASFRGPGDRKMSDFSSPGRPCRRGTAMRTWSTPALPRCRRADLLFRPQSMYPTPRMCKPRPLSPLKHLAESIFLVQTPPSLPNEKR